MTRPTAAPGEFVCIARHNKSRAAWLRLRRAGELVELTAVLPEAGPLPDCADLLGQYLDTDGARRAVLARLRSPRRDTLDRVLLTAEAVRAWEALAPSVAEHLARAGVSPDQIPDEQAEQQPDGSLMIYVEADGRRLGMGVPRGHWRWMRRE